MVVETVPRKHVFSRMTVDGTLFLLVRNEQVVFSWLFLFANVERRKKFFLRDDYRRIQ